MAGVIISFEGLCPQSLAPISAAIKLQSCLLASLPKVMLLKLNKEGPFKKDVFRAPGHQGNMRKLIHFLQQGRLVNIHNFSVNTIASVLKKFLRKLPGGVFGPENEATLFSIVKLETEEEKLKVVQR